MAIEPQTGYVRTLVGGTNWEETKVNLALGWGVEDRLGGGSGRQAGSSFKPFVLARAFEGASAQQDLLRPRHHAPGLPEAGLQLRGRQLRRPTWPRPWRRRSTRCSCSSSSTSASSRRPRWPSASASPGIDLDKPVYGGIAIGTQGGLAARHVVGLRRVRRPGLRAGHARPQDHRRDGTILEDNTKQADHPGSEEPVADNMNKILTGVVEGGTGTAAKIGRPAAGKTGTSEEYQNAWFVGYTPILSTAVWMGYSDRDQKRSQHQGRV